MNDFVFLIINASVMCFIVSYGLLKLSRSKLLLVCLIVSPFILIPAFSGQLKDWLIAYVFVLQYGGLGVVLAILLFEIDQIKRARKLRFLTSMLAKAGIALAGLYVFIYVAKVSIMENTTVQSSLEYASLFGLVEQKDMALVEAVGRLFTVRGVVVSVICILLCFAVIGLNKYRAFKEVYRV